MNRRKGWLRYVVVLASFALAFGAGFPVAAQASAVSAPPTGPSGVAVGPAPTASDPGWTKRTAAEEHAGVMPLVPNGFLPLQATNAQLAYYGLPQRPPAGTVAATIWVQQMQSFKREVPATFYDAPDAAPTLSPASIGGNTATKSTTWSGNIDPYNANPYNDTQANWVVTSASPTAKNSYSYTWVGMNGHCASSCAQLVQDGTSANYVSGKANYFAWYEICCTTNPRPVVLGNTVAPGDVIFASTSLLAPNEAEFRLCINQTCIQPITENFSGPAGGGEADFIVERPEGMLADYGQTGFANAEEQQQNSSLVCAGTPFHDDAHMYTDTTWKIQISAPYAFTDPNGCDFPVKRLNPGS